MESAAMVAREKVRLWADVHRTAVLYDDERSTLLDVISGKALRLSWNDVAGLDEKTHPETGEPYLVILFENGLQIALVDPGGIAFSPSTVNSGALENLPQVVCLRDFLTLKQRADHYLYDHPDEAPPRECLDVIMACIAILDRARSIGFDVNDLEGDLERSLNELERRAG